MDVGRNQDSEKSPHRCAEGMLGATENLSTSPEPTFLQLFAFLSQHHWIHDLQLTKFFESEVWNRIPPEWTDSLSALSLLDLNNLPFLYDQSNNRDLAGCMPRPPFLPSCHTAGNSGSCRKSGSQGGLRSCANSVSQASTVAQISTPLQASIPCQGSVVAQTCIPCQDSGIPSQVRIPSQVNISPKESTLFQTSALSQTRTPLQGSIQTHTRTSFQTGISSQSSIPIQTSTVSQSSTPLQASIPSQTSALFQTTSPSHACTIPQVSTPPQASIPSQTLSHTSIPHQASTPPYASTPFQASTPVQDKTANRDRSCLQTSMETPETLNTAHIFDKSQSAKEMKSPGQKSNESCNTSKLCDSLSEFLHTASCLSRHRLQTTDALPSPTPVGNDLSKGMSPKKLHEVERMASLVYKMASESGCSVVVDVGSGLGYLGQVLHKTYGLSVIGLESCTGHSEKAEKRTSKQGLQCSGIRSIPFMITDDDDNTQSFCDLIRDITSSFQPCQHSLSSLNENLPEMSAQDSHLSCVSDNKVEDNSANVQELLDKKDSLSSASEEIGDVKPAVACENCLQLDKNQSVSFVSKQTDYVGSAEVEKDCLRLDTNDSISSALYESGHVNIESVCKECTRLNKNHLVSSASNYVTPAEVYEECIQLGKHHSCVLNKMNKVSTADACEECVRLDKNHLVSSASNNVKSAEVCEKCTRLTKINTASSGRKLTSNNDTRHREKENLDSDHAGRTGTEGLHVCLIGLHCCGDLTPAMLRLYHRVDFLKSLCCVSCCYHKMNMTSPAGSDRVHFTNFPMSAAAKTAYSEVCTERKPASSSSSSSFPSSSSSSPSTASYLGVSSNLSSLSSPLVSSSSETVSCTVSRMKEGFLTPCSLRLAAQETRSRWAMQTTKDHDNHVRHVAYRALLEILHRDSGHTSPDRKCVRKLDYSSFDAFVKSYMRGLSLGDAQAVQTTEGRLRALYDKYKQHFCHIQPYTCLQVVVQPVLEWLILRDRQHWLSEQGLHAHLVPVFDPHLSPRNLALLSFKKPNI